MIMWLLTRLQAYCNTPSPSGQKRYVFLTSYLNSGTKWTESPLKTDCFQAKNLIISPCKTTEVQNI